MYIIYHYTTENPVMDQPDKNM